MPWEQVAIFRSTSRHSPVLRRKYSNQFRALRPTASSELMSKEEASAPGPLELTCSLDRLDIPFQRCAAIAQVTATRMFFSLRIIVQMGIR